MKIEFTTTPKDFEMLNFIIKQAVDSLNVKSVQKRFKVTQNDVDNIEKIRLKMVKSFTKKISK